jgi:hypothetical protein
MPGWRGHHGTGNHEDQATQFLAQPRKHKQHQSLQILLRETREANPDANAMRFNTPVILGVSPCRPP